MTAERKAVSKGAVALLDGTYGSFDLSHMAISRHDIEMDGSEVGLDTGELMVAMDVRDGETPEGIKVDDTT